MPANLQVRLIDAPALANCCSMDASRSHAMRREGTDPVIHCAGVDGDTAFSKPLDHVGIAQPKVELPADGKADHFVGKAVTAEG